MSGPDPFFDSRADRIVALATLPCRPDDLLIERITSKAGGLMSYGASIAEAYRHAGRLRRPHSQG